MKNSLAYNFTFFALFFFYGISANGQLSFGKEFDKTLVAANDAFLNQEFDKSGKLYDVALSLKNGVYPLSGYHKDAIEAWSKAGNKERTFFHLKKLIERGWVSLSVLNKNTFFDFIRTDERWEEIVEIVAQREIKYGYIVQSLKEINIKDQLLRQLIKCSQNHLNSDSLSKKYFWELIAEQDAENLEIVESLIEKHGWIGQNKVGDEANKTLWLIIQHASLEIQLKYLPLIKESVFKGETPASEYAFLIDRILISKDNEQLYGTQVYNDTEKSIYKIFPIKDYKDVNIRRKEIGFEPIEEYLNFFEIHLNSINNLPDFFYVK